MDTVYFRSFIAVVWAIVVLAAPQAVALNDSGGSQASGATQESGGGGAEISAHVEVSYSSAGGGGGSSSSTSTSVPIKPSCGYVPGETAEQFEKDHGLLANAPTSGGWDSELKIMYPNFRDHRGDSGGRWWKRYCDRDAFPDELTWAREGSKFINNNPQNMWIPSGQSPPAPYISPAWLAEVAWQAVKIPAPTVETNPKVGDRGATLVGMDTWVWATGNTPTSVTATATAGGTTATVTAGSAGLQLSAPDGKASCTGFGIAWHSGMAEGSSPCTISFNRSSAHLGGSTPLTVKVAYSASYTATDGNSGTLPAITTTSTVDLPVAEVQTLTTNGKNPRNT